MRTESSRWAPPRPAPVPCPQLLTKSAWPASRRCRPAKDARPRVRQPAGPCRKQAPLLQRPARSMPCRGPEQVFILAIEGATHHAATNWLCCCPPTNTNTNTTRWTGTLTTRRATPPPSSPTAPRQPTKRGPAQPPGPAPRAPQTMNLGKAPGECGSSSRVLRTTDRALPGASCRQRMSTPCGLPPLSCITSICLRSTPGHVTPAPGPSPPAPASPVPPFLHLCCPDPRCCLT